MKNYKLIFVLFFILTSCKQDPCKDDPAEPPFAYLYIKLVNTEGENLYEISDNEYTKELLEIKGFEGTKEMNIHYFFAAGQIYSQSELANFRQAGQIDSKFTNVGFSTGNPNLTKIVLKYNENISDTLFLENKYIFEATECFPELLVQFDLKFSNESILCNNCIRNRENFIEIIKE